MLLGVQLADPSFIYIKLIKEVFRSVLKSLKMSFGVFLHENTYHFTPSGETQVASEYENSSFMKTQAFLANFFSFMQSMKLQDVVYVILYFIHINKKGFILVQE